MIDQFTFSVAYMAFFTVAIAASIFYVVKSKI